MRADLRAGVAASTRARGPCAEQRPSQCAARASVGCNRGGEYPCEQRLSKSLPRRPPNVRKKFLKKSSYPLLHTHDVDAKTKQNTNRSNLRVNLSFSFTLL